MPDNTNILKLSRVHCKRDLCLNVSYDRFDMEHSLERTTADVQGHTEILMNKKKRWWVQSSRVPWGENKQSCAYRLLNSERRWLNLCFRFFCLLFLASDSRCQAPWVPLLQYSVQHPETQKKSKSSQETRLSQGAPGTSARKNKGNDQSSLKIVADFYKLQHTVPKTLGGVFQNHICVTS